ncbi:amidase [Actinokineospora terrae]|uniref:Amidase n=1 Tax=Actinokineospora terrae TaxID=155974 RepID=A0A1H9RUV3_9PSEU|nr:amidase [Actinokineospora terrae]SER75903.1 amidase [Actinokineospora terrae]
MLGLEANAQALAAGSTTSVALTTAVLDSIRQSQPTLNAFRRVREVALTDAAAADRALGAGERLPLLGVPVAIKDDVDIAGEPTAFGCPGEFPAATADCALVGRLKAAGAVIVGKTNTPEFGQWPVTEGSAFGVTRNPWDLGRTPGGSSGGSAAAVAAGLVPAAVGSDGAGSVRIPAAWTHLVGIKPQRGRVSSPDLFHGITTDGVLARTVGDAALLLEVLAGAPFRDAADIDPGRLRIGLSLRPAFTGMRVALDPLVRTAVVRLARVLRSLGHEIVVANPDYGLIGLNFLPRSLGGVHDWHDRVPDPLLLDTRTLSNGRLGALLRGRGLRAANATLRLFQRRVGRVFDRVDVLLTPTTASLPLPVGAIDGLRGWQTDQAIIRACPYAWPWNVLGWPAMNVPAGLVPLPVGAQLLGRADSERQLISLAAQLESVERWDRRWPS